MAWHHDHRHRVIDMIDMGNSRKASKSLGVKYCHDLFSLIMLMLVLLLQAPLIAGVIKQQPADGCKTIGDKVVFDCVTDTTGALKWNRERSSSPTSPDQITDDDLVFDGEYTVEYDAADANNRISNLVIASMTNDMIGDKYYCEVGPSNVKSNEASLEEKDTSTYSWFPGFNIDDVSSVSCNSDATLLSYTLSLDAASQRPAVNITISLDGTDTEIETREEPWECSIPPGDVTISNVDISAGGDLTIKVVIDHPMLAVQEHYFKENVDVATVCGNSVSAHNISDQQTLAFALLTVYLVLTHFLLQR